MRSIRPLLGVASLFTACATTSDVPDTERQRKVRTDFDACNVASGNKAHRVVITPEGGYSFQAYGQDNARTVLTCMESKGYSSRLIILDIYGYTDRSNPERFRVGGAGEPSR